MMGLEAPGLWESGWCVSLWPSLGSETLESTKWVTLLQRIIISGGQGRNYKARPHRPSSLLFFKTHGLLSRVACPLENDSSHSRWLPPTPASTSSPCRPSSTSIEQPWGTMETTSIKTMKSGERGASSRSSHPTEGRMSEMENWSVGHCTEQNKEGQRRKQAGHTEQDEVLFHCFPFI